MEQLRAEGTPRLLLVAPDASAPDVTACDEDWIRMPADDADVRARASTLASRAARHSPRPEVNGDGRIKFRGRWAPLSQTEEPLARALAQHRKVVSGRPRFATSRSRSISRIGIGQHRGSS